MFTEAASKTSHPSETHESLPFHTPSKLETAKVEYLKNIESDDFTKICKDSHLEATLGAMHTNNHVFQDLNCLVLCLKDSLWKLAEAIETINLLRDNGSGKVELFEMDTDNADDISLLEGKLRNNDTEFHFIICPHLNTEFYKKFSFQWLIPVVEPKWVEKCILSEKLVKVNPYANYPTFILKEFTIYISKTTFNDTEYWLLCQLVTYLGGFITTNLSSQVSHIISNNCNDPILKSVIFFKEEKEKNEQKNFPTFVYPNWILNCFRTGNIDTDLFEIRNINNDNLVYSSGNSFLVTNWIWLKPTRFLQDCNIVIDLNINDSLLNFIRKIIENLGGNVITNAKYKITLKDHIYLSDSNNDVFIKKNTISWLFNCILQDRFIPTSSQLISQIPTQITYNTSDNIIDKKTHDRKLLKICYTNFYGIQKFHIQNLINLLNCSPYDNLTKDCDILITRFPKGSKYKHVKEIWDTKCAIVNYCWLEDSLIENNLKDVNDPKYNDFDKILHFDTNKLIESKKYLESKAEISRKLSTLLQREDSIIDEKTIITSSPLKSDDLNLDSNKNKIPGSINIDDIGFHINDKFEQPMANNSDLEVTRTASVDTLDSASNSFIEISGTHVPPSGQQNTQNAIDSVPLPAVQSYNQAISPEKFDNLTDHVSYLPINNSSWNKSNLYNQKLDFEEAKKNEDVGKKSETKSNDKIDSGSNESVENNFDVDVKAKETLDLSTVEAQKEKSMENNINSSTLSTQNHTQNETMPIDELDLEKPNIEKQTRVKAIQRSSKRRKTSPKNIDTNTDSENISSQEIINIKASEIISQSFINGKSIKPLYCMNAVYTNCLDIVSKIDVKILELLGVKLFENVTNSNKQKLNTIIAPKRLRTVKFFIGLSFQPLEFCLTHYFILDLLQIVHDNVEMTEKTSINLDLNKYRIPEVTDEVLKLTNLPTKVFERHGITSINVIHDIPGGAPTITRILQNHGIKKIKMLSRSFTKSDIEANDTADSAVIPRYIFVATRQTQVKKFTKLINNSTKKDTIFIVEWNWIVDAIFKLRIDFQSNTNVAFQSLKPT